MFMYCRVFGERNAYFFFFYEKSFKECFTTHLAAFESSAGLGSSNNASIVTTEGNEECAHIQTCDFRDKYFHSQAEQLDISNLLEGSVTW